MATHSRSSNRVPVRLLGGLALVLFVLRLAFPADLAGQEDRKRVDARAVQDSFAYRVATFDPTSGPPGTRVSVHWQYLPAITPVRLGVGATRVGFEALREILTSTTGEFTDTISIPQWAESNRPHMLVVLDFYFRPLAVSDGFQVTDADGSLSREGTLQESVGKCARFEGEGGELYYLSGDLGGFKTGDRALVKGTLGSPALCDEGERGVTIKVASVRRPIGAG